MYTLILVATSKHSMFTVFFFHKKSCIPSEGCVEMDRSMAIISDHRSTAIIETFVLYLSYTSVSVDFVLYFLEKRPINPII